MFAIQFSLTSLPRTTLPQPKALSLDLMEVANGRAIDLTGGTIFFLMGIVSKVDVSVLGMQITVGLGTESYTADPLPDLSEWVEMRKIKISDWPYENRIDVNMSSQSLWNDLETNPLLSGIQKRGWIGVHIGSNHPHLAEQFKSATIAVRAAKWDDPFIFTFQECKLSSVMIVDAAFRRR